MLILCNRENLLIDLVNGVPRVHEARHGTAWGYSTRKIENRNQEAHEVHEEATSPRHQHTEAQQSRGKGQLPDQIVPTTRHARPFAGVRLAPLRLYARAVMIPPSDLRHLAPYRKLGDSAE